MAEDKKVTTIPQPEQAPSEVKVVKTDGDAKNGQTKCPKCGSTDITLDVKTGKLCCNFCHNIFDPVQVTGLENDISKLQGTVIGSGAKNIDRASSDFITIKCTSCGAEVVVDTASAMGARCHWCRNYLSVNEQVPNGSVPDVVLPFKVPKEEARTSIETFVGKRKFFAHPQFKQEFTTENIMGVYFPYMVVDVNSHAKLVGQGEHEVRRYTVGTGDDRETYYDADLYDVSRDFDLTIDGLTIESNSDRLNNTSKEKTNNIINSIMPFDIENCVKYDANYLRGYNSEKRDTDVEQLDDIIYVQSKDIARHAANDTLSFYDRGVEWQQEDFNIKGSQWKAAYLPVWLYSYQQVKKDNSKLLHYVAVNARTKETMGSVPIHMPKLLFFSFLVEILGVFLFYFSFVALNSDSSDDGSLLPFVFLLSGIIFFFAMKNRYRNAGARHTYEKETKKQMSNLIQSDVYVRRKTQLKNSRMTGANNTRVEGIQVAKKTANKIIDEINKNINQVNDEINKNK